MTPAADPKHRSLSLALITGTVSGATRAFVRWLLDWAISA